MRRHMTDAEKIEDLEKQLTVNQVEIAEVRSWLNGTLTCGNTD